MNKEVNEKKKKYAIIISFLVLMICVTGGTYAYFALTASNNAVTGTVGGASLNLTVTKVYPTSEHNNKNMIPQLESTLDEAISLDHKCVDGNGNVICQVYSATVTNQGSTASVLNGTISFTGIENMPNLKWMRINDSNTLGTFSSSNASTEEALFEEERSFGANTSNTYYFVFWIDETGEVQTDSGTFRANIEFDSSTGGLTSTVRPLLTEYIEGLYNDGSTINTVNIADDTNNQAVSLNNVQRIMKVDQGSTYGVEYRYYGNDTEEDTANGKYLTKNYVEYNGELWRIISSGTVYSSEEDTTGETRVRIIRADSIGYHAWDAYLALDADDYINDWTTSTLNTTLNEIYYNRISGTCYMRGEWTDASASECDYANGDVKGLNDEARSLISDAVWYLGGGNTSDLYADNYYSMERGTTTYSGNPTNYVAKLGIMYPSDYAYATDLSVCKKTGRYYDNDTTNCTGTDWLFNSDTQWLISPYSGNYYDAWYVGESGYVYGNGFTWDISIARGVRPVAVLSSDVVITGGEGTSDSPYRLGLGT